MLIWEMKNVIGFFYFSAALAKARRTYNYVVSFAVPLLPPPPPPPGIGVPRPLPARGPKSSVQPIRHSLVV